jgi:hypothetical protein
MRAPISVTYGHSQSVSGVVLYIWASWKQPPDHHCDLRFIGMSNAHYGLFYFICAVFIDFDTGMGWRKHGCRPCCPKL